MAGPLSVGRGGKTHMLREYPLVKGARCAAFLGHPAGAASKIAWEILAAVPQRDRQTHSREAVSDPGGHRSRDTRRTDGDWKWRYCR